jgi:hypothetical protein
LWKIELGDGLENHSEFNEAPQKQIWLVVQLLSANDEYGQRDKAANKKQHGTHDDQH